jgi:endoglucanase
MKRLALVIAACLALSSAVAAAPIELKRGVGVHDWLNWAPLAADGSYLWPPYRDTDEWLSGARPLSDWPAGDQFERIRAMGFDFIRLSVDPGPLLASDGRPGSRWCSTCTASARCRNMVWR